MNGAQLVVDVLRAEGVSQVYGLPGTTITDVLDALAGQDDIRYLSVRHEQVAASMADGFSRASGQIGVCIASRGPGAMNMSTAISNAYDESVPMLALIGRMAHDVTGRSAFKELDVVSTFRPISKWAVEIPSADRIPELLQRAIRRALTGRPGPVVVSLPLDVLKAPAEAAVSPRFRPVLPRPASSGTVAAARLLGGASRPVMIVGGGVRSFAPEVIELAEQLGSAVVTTWSRKDRFPNDHSLFVGALGAGSLECTETAVREADVVLALGCRFSEFTTRRGTLLPEQAPLVHVDIDPDELGKVYQPRIGLHSDAGAAAADLRTALGPAPCELDAIRNHWVSRLRQSYLDDQVPVTATTEKVSSAELTVALQEALRAVPATLVVDAPSTGTWIQRYLDFTQPRSFHASAGGATAWGFPAALGIQLAQPTGRVLCLSGDGSFWMVAQDLETAVREKIPVVTVVANNFAHENPDLAEFARLHGAFGARVTQADQLLPAIVQAFASGGPAVVDVVQDQHEIR